MSPLILGTLSQSVRSCSPISGGKLFPSFPSWFIGGTTPSPAAWFLQERILPPIYWNGMLKGREWMAKAKAAA